MTYRTPLPEKIGETPFINERMTRIDLVRAVDQLIDVVAELREVVEGKMDKIAPGSISIESTYPVHRGTTTVVTPSLKEQLLRAIKEEKEKHPILYTGYDQGFFDGLKEAEAIINRLIP